MSTTQQSGEHRAAAQSLGLRVPAYLHLRQALAAGEAPLWLRAADPKLAGMFADPFAFELLCERVEALLAQDRRRDNLKRTLEKHEQEGLLDALNAATDEGELEDLSFLIEPSPAPEGWEAPDNEALTNYVQALRGSHQVAAALRAAFRSHGQIVVEASGKDDVDAAPFKALIDTTADVSTLPPAKYLQVRRGERAHALKVNFQVPLGQLKTVFEKSEYPPQESDRYFAAFQSFANEERLPRLIQEARATLKRGAETAALRSAWEQLEFSIDRGRHQGSVLGVCAVRGGKVQLALVGVDGEYQRAVLLSPKSPKFADDLAAFLGAIEPGLIAYQGDTASRNIGQKLARRLRTPAAAAATPTSAPKTPPQATPAAEAVPAAVATPAADVAPSADAAPTTDAAPSAHAAPTTDAAPPAVVAPATDSDSAAEPATSAEAAPATASSEVENQEAPASPTSESPTSESPTSESPTAEAGKSNPPKPAPQTASFAASKAKGGKAKKGQDSGRKIRLAHVPLSVARTLQREVARRGAETLLSHDERQAFLLARFAWDPRAAALHTPHVVRAFISFRGEINHRRLEEFEVTFLRSLLLEKGVDLNQDSLDVLRMVPGLDAEGVVIERSTGAFLSLADYQERMCPSDRDWRASACLLRIKGGADALDARPLHPIYYQALRTMQEASNQSMSSLLREPHQLKNLDWEEVLQQNQWPKAVRDLIQHGLERSHRRRRRPIQGGAPHPGKSLGGPHKGPRRGGKSLDTLEVGSTVQGKVTALMDYGAFVDIGAKTEGLVHISQMADTFVKDPTTILKVGQAVEARILSVDLDKNRFRLSLRSEEVERSQSSRGQGQGRDRDRDRGPSAPAYVRNTRPKSRPGGGRPGGSGGRGGPGGRDQFDRPRKGEKIEKDPRPSKKEDIDPTNPFFLFFQESQDS
jgi:transcriptional accessory protein Tex/SPT6